jgi:hypothetical protein
MESPEKARTAGRPSVSGKIQSERALLAVGVPKGLVLPPAGNTLEPTAWVHAGGGPRPLSPAEYQMWNLALIPRTDSEIMALAAQFEIAGAEEIVSSMVSAGLFISVEPTTKGVELANVRVIPLAFGAGNDPSRRDVWRVVDPGRGTTLEVDALSYGLWNEFDGRATVGEACSAVVESFLAVHDKDTVFAVVPRLLLMLMSVRYIFVDGPVDDAAFD